MTVEKRFQEHICDSNKRRNEKRPLYSAIRKYGKEYFYVEKIEVCEDAMLSDREEYWIEKFDSFHNGYNATHGGDGKTRFDHDKIFEELLLCPYSSIVAKRVGCSIDTVRAVAKENGATLHKIQRERLVKDYCHPKGILCYKDGFIMQFDSVADSAKWLYKNNIAESCRRSVQTHIADCAKGKAKTAYGLKWSYIS